jgi:hypothetical protein
VDAVQIPKSRVPHTPILCLGLLTFLIGWVEGPEYD